MSSTDFDAHPDQPDRSASSGLGNNGMKTLYQIANSFPVPVVNTQTLVPFKAGIGTSTVTGTTVDDIRGLAENLMYDATKLVVVFDEGYALQSPQATNSSDSVSLTSVLRGGATIAGAFGVVCGVGSALSGATLMHPLLSILLVVGSFGFYLMSFVRN